MIFVTYQSNTGALVGISADIPAPTEGHCTRAIDADSVDVAKWNAATLRFDDELTASVVTLTKLEYLRRFTSQERVTIRTVAKSNPVLEDYLAMLDIAESVNLSDPDTVGAVLMLEQAGLIASGRAAEILS